MTTLLVGKTGQVATAIQEIWGNDQLVVAGRDLINLESKDSITSTLLEIKPKIIINAAAYTNVEKAEEESGQAFKINSEALKVIGRIALDLDALVVHYSTDYVFDGKSLGLYVETDSMNPLNVYGKSKMEGEYNLINSGSKHLIFRTSWVYSSFGNNFVKTVVRKHLLNEKMKIVSDQVGSPTSAIEIAIATRKAVNKFIKNKEKGLSGIYHLTASGHTSWYNFALQIISELSSVLDGDTLLAMGIEPIKSDEYSSKATRPLNSRLSNLKYQNTFDHILPKWDNSIKPVVSRIKKELGYA